MTFAEIHSQWQRCRTREQKRALWEQLARGGWFDACCNAVQQGDHRATLETWLSEEPPIVQFKGAEAAQMVRAHLLCARATLDAKETSGTVSADALQNIADKLHPSSLIPHPFPLAFLRDLTEQLLDAPRESQGNPVRVLFPLVWTDRAEGVLAQFALERLPNGCGEVFLAPRQAFVPMDDDFLSIFANAPAAVRALVPSAFDGCDVRVTIEAFNDAEQNELWRGLRGRSAGGALALGLWSLTADTPLEKGIVVSAEITDDGKFLPIGAGITKAIETAKAGLQVFLTGSGSIAPCGRSVDEPDVETRARELGVTVEPKSTLKEAAEFASGRLRELLAYLDACIAEANKLPPYYPKDARLERVRVRVRVSSERQRFDPRRADERERTRRAGLADEESIARAYAHRNVAQSDRLRHEEWDWDKDVRGKVRRGVIVGDPGLGKTWLLKWEAKRHAEEAKQQLLTNGDVSRITIPVNLRLTDVAEALANGATTLAEAIVTSLPDAAKSVRDLVSERLGSDKCLLLLDAFDEVPADKRHGLLTALGEWVPKHPQARVFFTSRAVGYVPPWRIAEKSETEREMELLPFDDAQISAFLDAFFGGNVMLNEVKHLNGEILRSAQNDKNSSDSLFAGDATAAQELRDILHRAPQLRGMAQYPLLLGFLCALYQEGRGTQSDRLRHFAELRRTELYESVLRRLLSGVWHDTPRWVCEPDVDGKLELLEHVALRLFSEGKEQFSMRELRQVTREIYQTLYPNDPLSDQNVTEKIRAWSETDGLLVKAGAGDNPPYLFLHLTIQEYLTACALAERANREGWQTIADLVDKKAWDPYWQEVIILLTGKLNDPTPPLQLLTDEKKDDYFRHRLALAGLCLPEIPEASRNTQHASVVDYITTAAFSLWWEHRTNNTNNAVPHLSHLLPTLAHVNGRMNGTPLLESLCQRLHNKDWEMNAAAGVRYLMDAAAMVRYHTAGALWWMGAAAARDDVLTAMLDVLYDDPNSEVCEVVAGALGAMGAAAARDDVITALLDVILQMQGCGDLTSRAARALEAMGEPAMRHIEFHLILFLEALRSEDRQARMRAAEALGWMGPVAARHPAVLPALVVALHDADSDVRKRAAEALGEMEEAAAREDVLTALVEIALHDEDKDVREQATGALGQMGASAARHPEVLPAMVTALHDMDRDMRRRTAGALGWMGKAAAQDNVLTALVVALRDPDKDVRREAAWALGRMGAAAGQHAEVFPALMSAQSDGEGDVRKSAMRALEWIGETAARDEVLTALVATLRNADKEMRCQAIRALGRMGAPAVQHPDVLPLLVNALRDVDRDVRGCAAAALRQIGEAAVAQHPEVLPALVEDALRDKDNWARQRALAALGQIGIAAARHPDVLSALEVALRHTDRDARNRAIEALGKMAAQGVRFFVRLEPRSVEELSH